MLKKQHPIAIIQYTKKNFWLLLIPLARGLYALNFDFAKWLAGAYLDILVLVAILGLAVLRWSCVKYEFDEKGIRFRSSFIIIAEYKIPYSVITSVSAKSPLLFRPLKAVKIFIDTDTHSVLNKASEADMKIVVPYSEYKDLQKIMPESNSTAKLTYTVPKIKLLLFSVLFSSTLSGIIYVGTLLIQGGKMVRTELESTFVTAVNGVTSAAARILNGVTPVTVGIIMVIAAGWLISFMSNYLRHIRFRIARRAEIITVKSGFFSRWYCRLDTKKINYADLRQNLLMKICKVTSVHVSCSGYGKEKNALPVFVPMTTSKSVNGVMRMLLPEFLSDGTDINPHWNYIMRFLGIPITAIFSVMIGGFAAILFFPEWYSVVLFLCIMGEVLSVHLLFVALAAYYTNGAGVSEKALTIAYCKGFCFHNVIIPLDKIAFIKIRRSVFQRMSDSCDVLVFTKSEARKCHVIIGLNITDAMKIAAKAGFSENEFGGRI